MKKDKKGAFHVTIVDNRTGTVMVDEEASVIIGAVSPHGKDKGIGVTCMHGSGEEILSTIKACREAAEEALSRLPDEAKVMDLFSRLISLMKKVDD